MFVLFKLASVTVVLVLSYGPAKVASGLNQSR